MAFTKTESNPNAPVGGGCIGIGGIRGYDCVGPFYAAEGVHGLNATCPRIVICEYHRGELNRAAAENEAQPVGYGQAEAQATERALTEHIDRVEPPKAKRTRKPKPAEELSL